MTTRRFTLALLAWLVVVALGSGLVWAVISRAGETLVSADQPLTHQTGVGSGGGRAGAHFSTPPATSPSVPPRASTSTGPSAPSSPTTAPTTTPTAPPSAPPSAPTSAPPAPSAPATSPSPSPRRRTWQGPGGTLIAQCDGTVISLQAALPDAGFAVEVASRGPVTLDVRFVGRGSDDGHQYPVTATCRGGVPRFSASSSGDD